MSFFDLIAELRKGTPDIKKAEKAMKILGWICLAGAVWNFILPQMSTSSKFPFNLPPEYPYVLLISLTLLGLLFFRSARGIREMEPWGKRAGQLAIVLLIGSMMGFMAFGISRFERMPSAFVLIFIVIFTAQFGIPAYFGIRYLGRLPVEDGSYASYRRRQVEAPVMALRESGERAEPQAKYKDALFPFGLLGTLAISIAAPLAIMFVLSQRYGEKVFLFIMPLFFIFIFLGPVIYNQLKSPFEKQREVLSSYTGGGSTFLFSGSWPFFNLLVYRDGVEIRVFFHRFFVPYDKMDDLQEKIGFFTMGILFKSDLPGVPSRIRFQGFGMKKILKLLNETRNNYLGRNA